MFACKHLGSGERVTCPTSDGAAKDLVIDGGFQECRGANIGSNKFYVENIAEELDDAREWFASGRTLSYIPNGTEVDLNDPKTSVVGAVLKNVVEVSGARGLTLRGRTVTHLQLVEGDRLRLHRHRRRRRALQSARGDRSRLR